MSSQEKPGSAITKPAEDIQNTDSSRVIIIHEIDTENMPKKQPEENSKIPKFVNGCYVKYKFHPGEYKSKIPIAERHKMSVKVSPSSKDVKKMKPNMPLKLEAKPSGSSTPKMMLTKDVLSKASNKKVWIKEPLEYVPEFSPPEPHKFLSKRKSQDAKSNSFAHHSKPLPFSRDLIIVQKERSAMYKLRYEVKQQREIQIQKEYLGPHSLYKKEAKSLIENHSKLFSQKPLSHENRDIYSVRGNVHTIQQYCTTAGYANISEIPSSGAESPIIFTRSITPHNQRR